MRTQSVILYLLLAVFLGASVYLLYRSPSRRTKGNVAEATGPSPTEQSEVVPKTSQALQSTPPPPPPPRPAGESTSQSALEPERALSGMTSEHVKQIQQYLPDGSQVATYPITKTAKMAAIATGDLNNDGIPETVVVYSLSRSKSPQDVPVLYLGVLLSEQNQLRMRATVPLYGTYVQNNIFNSKTVPFALRDVIGIRRKEIVVTSSLGASLGSVLQVFSFQDSSLHQLAGISGDIIELESIGDGKPSLIIARSRNQNESKTYHWNGTAFQL